ncbi:glycosyltransferase family A protein [Pedobacter sp. G11]|uniref:glycosyltransferase family A protein n=1 Tax=Pedobacter sp. G11 TaxID=2482728 RepID=UPI00143CDF45|nr:glycosyltransferase family A protein [Pedobacter sp. G11]
MNKIISVILPVYNAGDYLTQSVNSVLNQDIDDYEFVICDDASTDSGLVYLRRIAEKYPSKVKVLANESNLGLFKTLNKLILNSTSTLIHLWSQDDLMKPNCLRNCIEFHTQHPNVSMSYHNLDYIDADNNIIPFQKLDGTPTIVSTRQYALTSSKWGCMAGNIANVTLNRKYLNEVGLFNEAMVVSGDFDLWTRLATISDIGRNTANLIYLRSHLGQLSKSYKTIALRIKEDIPIHKRIIDLLHNHEKKVALRFWKWKILPSYFNDLLFLYYKKEFAEYRILLNLLKKESNIYLLSTKWIVIRVARFVKMDLFIYKNILDS